MSKRTIAKISKGITGACDCDAMPGGLQLLDNRSRKPGVVGKDQPVKRVQSQIINRIHINRRKLRLPCGDRTPIGHVIVTRKRRGCRCYLRYARFDKVL